MYTIPEARATLAALLPRLDEIVALRADTAELAAAVAGAPSALGSTPEFKAAQALLDEQITEVQATVDLQLKGLAPLLLDFPAEIDGVPVLLCWLEGDRELGWYHRLDLGFAGRRPLPSKIVASR